MQTDRCLCPVNLRNHYFLYFWVCLHWSPVILGSRVIPFVTWSATFKVMRISHFWVKDAIMNMNFTKTILMHKFEPKIKCVYWWSLFYFILKTSKTSMCFWDAMENLGTDFNGVLILCLGRNSVCIVLKSR